MTEIKKEGEIATPEEPDKMQMILDALMDIKAMLVEFTKTVPKEEEKPVVEDEEEEEEEEKPEEMPKSLDVEKIADMVAKKLGVEKVVSPKPSVEVSTGMGAMTILESVRKGVKLEDIGRKLIDGDVV